MGQMLKYLLKSKDKPFRSPELLRARAVEFCLLCGPLSSTGVNPEWESNSGKVDRAEQGPTTCRERVQGACSYSW